ncbi:uncharacterized protein [Oscarella lobularis]|uniref:uncharacterized protein n=1 Tax=Oscarella lobularis TaxID=121494 RepID=UPI003313CEBF
MEMYVSLFQQHAVTSGEVLLELTETHLREMGVTTIGHRLLLTKRIRDMKGTGSASVSLDGRMNSIGELFQSVVVLYSESVGNVDKRLYRTMPDSRMYLTERGVEQARRAGQRIKDIIANESIACYISPFTRSKQTFDAVKLAFRNDQVTWTEEPRIREQEWGNFQDPEKVEEVMEERRKIGSFYFRFPTGESGADVYDRVSSFLETLYRDMKKGRCKQNILLVTHGLTSRLFLMRYFHWEVERFHRLWNLENGEFVVLELQPEGGYILTTELKSE